MTTEQTTTTGGSAAALPQGEWEQVFQQSPVCAADWRHLMMREAASRATYSEFIKALRLLQHHDVEPKLADDLIECMNVILFRALDAAEGIAEAQRSLPSVPEYDTEAEAEATFRRLVEAAPRFKDDERTVLLDAKAAATNRRREMDLYGEIVEAPQIATGVLKP